MNILEPSKADSRTPETRDHLSTLCWSVVATLLSFLCLTQLLVMLCFSLHWNVSPVVAPIALFLSLVMGDWFARREGLRRRHRAALCVIVLGISGISLLLAGLFFDMSWDGLWYHQKAVYQMSHGWNPLYDPMHDFVPHAQSWLRYYAKGPWYISLALYETTGNIEIAKAAPWITLGTTFLAVFAVSLDVGMNRAKALLVAATVALNPVVTCQLASFLVDGLMVSYLACFVAATIRWFKRPGLLVLASMACSIVLCTNAKFTGLVYACFFCTAGGFYALMRRRDVLWRYTAIQIAAFLTGIVIFGFNPYVTNMVHRGHPFYPILGTTAYPSLSESGRDPIEIDETPRNMAGRNRFIRFAYAIFGRPGSPPFFEGDNAVLMWPFDVSWKDFNIFYFHEVRISGFGPLFSGVLLIGFVLLGISLLRPGLQREPILLLIGAIILSVLISKHTWWARYGPQLWWLPITAVFSGFNLAQGARVRIAATILAAILLVNAGLVAFAHFRWEIQATRATNEQMAVLRQSKGIEVDLQYFGEPFSERLRAAGVTFHPVQHLQCSTPMELMSVAPGYPGAVRACMK